ncbi:MAG TPA: glycosyltransferase family 4 protein [Ktedonobacteraceae bacterium]|jgi:glycosyltransferase involved in cell wall biosynthesis
MRILCVYNLNQVARSYQQDLVQLGHSVDLFEPSLAGAGAARPLKLALLGPRLFDLRRVVGALRPACYDLVHIHWAAYGLLGFASRIPVLLECHGSDVRARLHHPLHRPLLQAILRRAAAVHCITPDLLPLVQAVRPAASFFPGPVDTARFAPAYQSADSRRPWRILLFMRLDPVKGAETAAQGILRFLGRHRAEAQVQVLDWGTLSASFKQRYAGSFTFRPRAAAHEVPHLLQQADVVVGQCQVGCFGFCELQAMSCAKAVITSFVYPQAYASPPPICQASRPEQIEAWLERLFQERGLAQEIGQRARAWVLAHHERRLLATRLEQRYRSLLSGQAQAEKGAAAL